MDKNLVRQVLEDLRRGYSRDEVAERLKQDGWHEDEIHEALAYAAGSHIRKARLAIALLGFAAFIVLGLLFYFIFISPSYVEEPEVVETVVQPQPALVVDETGIGRVLTGLGAYKLHANPFTGDLPEIEVVVTDTNQVFGAVVKDKAVQVVQGSAGSPDARIYVTKDAVLRLASAQDEQQLKEFAMQVFSERNERGYRGELVAGQADLLLKGYLALYKEAKETAPSGAVVSGIELAGSQVTGMFLILVVLWGALLVRVAFYR